MFPEYFENSGVFDVVLTGEAETSLPKVFGKERFDFFRTFLRVIAETILISCSKLEPPKSIAIFILLYLI